MEAKSAPEGAQDLEHELESVACDYCGSREARRLYREGETKAGVEIPPIVRCESCGLCYLSPRLTPEALVRLYDESYFHSDDSGTKGYDDYLGDREDIHKTFHRRLAKLEKFRGGERGRLLDVGRAAGFCLDVAKERGWETEGIEISSYAAEKARERGLTVHVGEFLPHVASLPDESFDAITMWDYIEHVRSPGEEIRRAHELLAPGGILAMATPNVGSWPARFFQEGWMGIKPHEHLYYFDPRSLGRYAEDAGFEFLECKHAGKYVSLSFFALRVGFYSPFLMRLLEHPLRWLRLESRSLYVNPFDIMIYTARKRPS